MKQTLAMIILLSFPATVDLNLYARRDSSPQVGKGNLKWRDTSCI
jgi:hypothetical protein